MPESEADNRAWLRRLAVIGAALPVLFVVALLLVVPSVARLWPERGHLSLAVLTGLCTAGYGVVMFALVDRGHRIALRRNEELTAVNEVLLRIAQERSCDATLADITRAARDLLEADDARLCLPAGTGCLTETGALGEPLCVTPEEAGRCRAAVCGARADVVTVPLRGAGGTELGRLRVVRATARPLDTQEVTLLRTFADLSVVALTHARMLEGERHGAILAERDRLAREMHDGLAQALGVTHLRLHSLRAHPTVAEASEVHGELADLAGICHEAYRDVREAILGLRETSRSDRTLVDGLRGYVDAFGRRSGIDASVETEHDDVVLPPQTEVQVLRVIQESLTNVRKHAGASRVAVRVTARAGDVEFVVEDDGRGFDPRVLGCDRERFGLTSMRERAELVRGRLDVASRVGGGTRVSLTVPRAPQALSDEHVSVGA